MDFIELPEGAEMRINGLRPIWRWYVFGKAENGAHPVVVETPFDVRLWRRILTRIFLGSVWERIDNG